MLIGAAYDHRVDVWALGSITYLMLSGFLPFDDPNEEKEIVRQTLNDDVPFPKTIWNHLSEGAKSFVESELLNSELGEGC